MPDISTRLDSSDSLKLELLSQSVRIRCPDPALRKVLWQNFEAMACFRDQAETRVDYDVGRDTAAGNLSLARADRGLLSTVEHTSDLVHLLEQDLVIELQNRRQDLLFLHSATLEWQGKAFLFTADSGVGKSTTAWGLLHHGFRYLSDELSPVDIARMQVHPYPHALCLKQRPPTYPLPSAAIDLGRTLHVPTATLPTSVVPNPCPIGAVFLLHREPAVAAPALRELTAAEAGARIYLTALNALAHDNHGLDAVAEIAERVPCFMLETADLAETCALIRTVAEKVIENDASLPQNGT